MAPSPSSKRNARVFLLEADALARGLLGRLVESEAGFRVCGEAADVAEALSRLPSARPDVAVVNLDPFGGAVEVFNRLRWAASDLPLIVLSMRDEAVHGRRLLQAGAAGYVTKAQAAEKILPALRRVLRGRVYGMARPRRHRRP